MDHPKTKGKVSALSPQLYAQWRLSVRPHAVVHDGDTAPPERLLQAVWFHQRLLREELCATDGRKVRVLHPGFWNHEAGPDFRGAVIQFAAETPVTGDVEVDLEPSGWKSHGHNVNAAYRNVVLHVIWRGTATGQLPTVALASALDAPVEELQLWLGGDGTGLPQSIAGKCSGPLGELPAETCEAVLKQAAMVRMQAKAAQFHARARQAGWEQALWEGMFRALGYKHNQWPMQRLAELRSSLIADATSPIMLQARLLGISGLLPTELTRRNASTDEYLRTVWDIWWREREAWGQSILPRSLWRLNGIRPANHPQRRLALAAHWLAARFLVTEIERWLQAELEPGEWVDSLLGILQAPTDEFWSWHWTLNSARVGRAQPLLGATRVTDLAVNVLLPWLWSRAVAGKNEKLRQVTERRYLNWPAAEDNTTLRLARQRLFGTSNSWGKRGQTAATQQGLLQIVKDFCDQSNALCEHCRFPELVRGIRR